ncbi:MAG TPA: sigma-70 family RNA polymerase sigma factor [Byssovorax sp.]|jgi:RNA polymerase sigma-70 factor (ECF subfamily)
MSAAFAMPAAAAQLTDDPLDLLDGIVRTRRGELAAVARREGLGAEDAVDAVQDALSTFLHLALRGELPRTAGELAPFLGGIVKNAARNRRRKHHVARPHDALDAAPADVDGDPSELVARAEEHVRLRACVDRLCDTQRAVVTMRLLDERDGEDVAHALGITRGHVDVLVHRAKVQLRACMID